MAFTGNFSCNVFKTGLANGQYNFTTDTFKIALYTNQATLDQTTSVYTPIGEVVASGYTAGGYTLTVDQTPTIGNSGDVAYLSFANAVWTAALTARGALIYKSGGGNPTVCVLDFGNDKTSVTSFTVTMPTDTSTSALILLS